jgi:hypothetical protein
MGGSGEVRLTADVDIQGATGLNWLAVGVALWWWWGRVADIRLKCPVGLCVMRNEWTVASAC